MDQAATLVESTDEVMEGMPVFKGTRVPRDVVTASLDKGIAFQRIRASYNFLTPEHYHHYALQYSAYAAVMDSCRGVMDGAASDLANNEDVKDFYLGVGGGERKSFKDVKSYKRRKRWLA